MTTKRGISAARRRRLGSALRQVRESAGLNLDQVADRLECSTSKISRVETGQIGVISRDVRDMLALYEVSPSDRDTIMAIMESSRTEVWWQPYLSVLTDEYISYEDEAAAIEAYEAQCVPGLLQTADYASALFLAARPDLGREDLDARIEVRLGRQRRLTSDDPLHFWCVIDEAALTRPVGTADVMRAQLRHLVEATELPNITLQVLPFDVGSHPGMDGSFVVLRDSDESDTHRVYVALATGGVFYAKAGELDRYRAIFRRLKSLALDPDRSSAFIAELAKESQ